MVVDHDLDLLEEAFEIVKDPDRWCVGSYARSAAGLGCDPRSEEAERFCIHGALIRVYGGAYDRQVAISSALTERLGAFWGLAEFNDSRTHSEMLAKFREAIDNIVLDYIENLG